MDKLKEKLKNICLKLWAFILSFSKKHKIITFIICLILLNSTVYHIQQAYSSIHYGGYTKFVRYPKLKMFEYYYMHTHFVRIDDDNALVFRFNRITKNQYNIYNLNLKTRKFNEYQSAMKYPRLLWGEKIGDKVYLIFDKDESYLSKQDIVVYDYKNDVIEHTYSDEIKEPIKVKIKNKEYILYKRERNNPRENVFSQTINELRLFDPTTNKVETINIPNLCVLTFTGFVGQTDNEILLVATYDKNYDAVVQAIDLNKRKIVYTNSGVYYNYFIQNFIWLGDNKFMHADKHRIITYSIDKTGRIQEIRKKEITKESTIVEDFFRKFDSESYIVLNPTTVIFSCGKGRQFHEIFSKQTHKYNYLTNEFKRITDFKNVQVYAKFFKLDDKSFLMYRPNTIYKFKLKG